MAGGFGKRLGKLTATTPKPLLLVKGKPIISHIIEQAKEFGFYDIIITAHFQAQKIKDELGNGSELGVSIRYIDEWEPLGTAGGLYYLPKFSGPCVVMNGDIIAEIDFFRFIDDHLRSRASVSMGVYKHQITNPFGVVEIKDSMVSAFKEKPVWLTRINSGIYVVDREIVDLSLKGKACDMNTFLNALLDNNHRIAAFDIDQWADLGDLETYHIHR
jgi:NDP-sugar pyrophosphorylase family protein